MSARARRRAAAARLARQLATVPIYCNAVREHSRLSREGHRAGYAVPSEPALAMLVAGRWFCLRCRRRTRVVA